MSQRQPSDELIQRYLLGSASEAESGEVEQFYLTDNDEYERLSAAEDELIDHYLEGRLHPEERHGFEVHFLNAAQRREKLAFARSMRAVAIHARAEMQAEAEPWWLQARRWFGAAPATGWWRWTGAATLAVAVFVSGLLLLEHRRLSKEIFIAGAEKEGLLEQNRRLRKELQEPIPSELQVVAAVLSPGLTRSGGASTRVTIPPPAHLAQLKLELFGKRYRSYRAIVRIAAGREVLSESHLRPSSRNELIVLVPVDLLRSGDYEIKLAGETPEGKYEPTASYSFRVVR